MDKRKIHKRKSKMGLAPGSFVFTGMQKVDNVGIELIQYREKEFIQTSLDTIQDAIQNVKKSTEYTNWLNIEGIHEVELVEELCKHFGIHRLTGEDIVSVGQRPKLDEFDDYLHLVLKMVMLEGGTYMSFEQTTFILKDGLLITFQEKSGDVFDHVRKRLEEGKGQIRMRSADYLMYALVDAVVDHYFVILEEVGERLDELEVEMLDNPSEKILAKLHGIRREALQLRRSVYPLREVVSQLSKIEKSLIHPETKLFLRDLYDHTIQAIETIEVFRDMASGMLDLYMNSISNKMNNVMKVLTVISTIFIPLTFIAGIYGMNFKYMPELAFSWAYPIVMLFMFIIAAGMVIYFRRKKWF
ncbi:MAG: magnesium/cobalt transporter CorA [Crocinitomicaceae bacterium]|nr:magnesium/cobalt transporter CorA [Crocinitomicaceae bacterium]